MRLVTYNVLAFGAKPWMRPWQRRYLGNAERLDGLCRVLDSLQPTLAGLQEIWDPVLFESLGRELGMSAVTAQSMYPARCGLLSRVPILRYRTRWFQDSPGAWGRSFLEAEVMVESRRLSVFVVHLPVHSTAMLYSNSFYSALRDRYADDAVLLGDFNCPPSFGVPRRLAGESFRDVLTLVDTSHEQRQAALVGPMRAWSRLRPSPADMPRHGHIDYIFVPDRLAHAVRDGGVLTNEHTAKISDHSPVYAWLDRSLLASSDALRQT